MKEAAVEMRVFKVILSLLLLAEACEAYDSSICILHCTYYYIIIRLVVCGTRAYSGYIFVIF